MMMLHLGWLMAAPSHATDFTGTWVLDRKASDSIDALLEAQGIGWVERTAARSLGVRQTIAQRGDLVTIELESAILSRTFSLRVDGVVRDLDTERGLARVHHVWMEEHLVSTSVRQTESGPHTLVTDRALAAGGETLIQRLTLHTADGTKVESTRIFRAAPSP